MNLKDSVKIICHCLSNIRFNFIHYRTAHDFNCRIAFSANKSLELTEDAGSFS